MEKSILYALNFRYFAFVAHPFAWKTSLKNVYHLLEYEPAIYNESLKNEIQVMS